MSLSRFAPIGALAVACAAPEVVVTLELQNQADATDTRRVRVVDDTFHLNGFASILDDVGQKVELRFAEGQSGPYTTSVTASFEGVDYSGNVLLDTDATWKGGPRFPFTYDITFLDGEMRDGSNDAFDVTGGGFTIRNQGCRSTGGLGASADCGRGWAWDEDPSASVRFPLGPPQSAGLLKAELCPDELVEQWLDEDAVIMTSSVVDLGAERLSCSETQTSARICGDYARGVAADGCDDWRVTVSAWPNATAGNPPFTLNFGAGATCGETYRSCRSTFYSSEAIVE